MGHLDLTVLYRHADANAGTGQLTPARSGPQHGGDNDFPTESMILLHRSLVAAFRGPTTNGASQMYLRPFIVSRDGIALFTVHAYSAQQARANVAARLSDTTGVRIVARKLENFSNLELLR